MSLELFSRLKRLLGNVASGITLGIPELPDKTVELFKLPEARGHFQNVKRL